MTEICPICYEDKSDFITKECNHNFHKKCLNLWLYDNYSCPMCRTLLKNKFVLKNKYSIKKIIYIYEYHIKIESFFSKNIFIPGNNLKSVYLDYNKKILIISCCINLKYQELKFYGPKKVLNSCLLLIKYLINSFTNRYN